MSTELLLFRSHLTDVDCSLPILPLNSNASSYEPYFAATKYKSVWTVFCNVGWWYSEQIFSLNTSCLANGSWTDTLEECQGTTNVHDIFVIVETHFLS